jgi:AcrR family transcriptional regulator
MVDDEANNRVELGTNEKILAATEAILAERGYERLSMREVGRRAGISQAAIYRHFCDKAALVGEVVARGYGRIVETLEASLRSEAGEAERIAAAMRSYIELSLERPELFKAVLLQNIGPAQAGTEVLAKGVSRGRRTMALFVGALEGGMATGAFARADAELTAQALWAAMYGLTARIALEGLEPSEHRSALIERQIEIAVKGLRA